MVRQAERAFATLLLGGALNELARNPHADPDRLLGVLRRLARSRQQMEWVSRLAEELADPAGSRRWLLERALIGVRPDILLRIATNLALALLRGDAAQAGPVILLQLPQRPSRITGPDVPTTLEAVVREGKRRGAFLYLVRGAGALSEGLLRLAQRHGECLFLAEAGQVGERLAAGTARVGTVVPLVRVDARLARRAARLGRLEPLLPAVRTLRGHGLPVGFLGELDRRGLAALTSGRFVDSLLAAGLLFGGFLPSAAPGRGLSAAQRRRFQDWVRRMNEGRPLAVAELGPAEEGLKAGVEEEPVGRSRGRAAPAAGITLVEARA